MLARLWPVCLTAVALSACQKTVDDMTWPEKKQLAQEIIARCEKDGERQGTPGFTACTNTYLNLEIKQRNDAQARLNETGLAISSGLANVSSGYYAAAAANTPRLPTYCSSTRYGTTCY